MPAAKKETEDMKRSAIVLALFAILALVPCAQSLAQAPAAPAVAPAPAPASDADFLATLSNGQDAAPGVESLPAGPISLSTLCHSNADCPTGQLCCYPCGIPDCHNICMAPVNKRCPMFV
jgi:hypothetical protein